MADANYSALQNALNSAIEGLKLVSGHESSSSGVARSMLRLLYERSLGDSEAARDVLDFLAGAMRGAGRLGSGAAQGSAAPKLAPPATTIHTASGRPCDVRLFSWQLSYFSAKVRAYLRFKSRGADGLVFDDVNASPALIQQLLLPLTQTNVVPQLQLPDGSFVQDSSDIIEAVEQRFPQQPVIPCATGASGRPRQRLACKLLELFGDEWLLTAAFHWRWAYSGAPGTPWQQLPVPHAGAGGSNGTPYLVPNHRAYNELQWGDFIAPPGASPARRRRSGAMLIDNVLLGEGGARGGLRALGVTTAELATAFETAMLHFLALFEAHLTTGATFVLGHRPSLADYGLSGPLYAHLYQDPVSGFILKTRFPLVSQWCERLHDRGGQFEPQRRCTYDRATESLIEERSVGGGAGHDGLGEWYSDDLVPPTLMAMLRCFFDEFWPVLVSTTRIMSGKGRTALGAEVGASQPLPSKSFSPTVPEQMGRGPLTHEFAIPNYAAGGRTGRFITGRRMVVPYQLYMLQRLCDDYLLPARETLGHAGLVAFLCECGDACTPRASHTGSVTVSTANTEGSGALGPRTPSLMQLPELLKGCRVEKRGGHLYWAKHVSDTRSNL